MRAINYRIIQLQKIALFLLSFLLLHAALAQEQARWIIGLSGGSAVYQGELSQDGFGSLRGQTLVWGGGVQFRPSPYWSLGLQGHLGELTAEDAFYPDDAFRMNRRFSFQTNFYDLALLGRSEENGCCHCLQHLRGHDNPRDQRGPFTQFGESIGVVMGALSEMAS